MMIRSSLSRLPLRCGAATLSTQSAAAAVQAPPPPPSLRQRLQWDEEARNDLAYCLSFSNDGSDFSRHMNRLFPDALMREQLEHSSSSSSSSRKPEQSKSHAVAIDQQPLPTTLEDALRPQKSRAIVVTEAVKPFRIVQVNTAWENLCGYTFVQSHRKTLGTLLKGPETDPVAATALIAQLLAGEPEASVTLTNYTGSGRRFRNRVRVGPLYDSNNGSNNNFPTHFVGVLQEVHDGM